MTLISQNKPSNIKRISINKTGKGLLLMAEYDKVVKKKQPHGCNCGFSVCFETSDMDSMLQTIIDMYDSRR